MNITAKLSFPKVSWQISQFLWGLLLVGGLYWLWPASIWLKAIWGLSIPIFIFWQKKIFKDTYKSINQIGCNEQNWWLLEKNNQISSATKLYIHITAGTRVWPFWLLIKYRRQTDNKRGSLLIFKDAVSDKDYRDLRRHLLFIEQDTQK